MPNALYRVNEEERKLLELAKEGHVEYFTDYYLRSPTSGTWWLPGAKADVWKHGYDRLIKAWKKAGRPADTLIVDDITYKVVFQHEKRHDFPTLPAFHHNHGFLFLPFQKQLHTDRHPIRTVVGGYGSGKTLSQVVSFLIHGATLSGFRAFALAPLSNQALEVQRLALAVIRGTLYEKRFLIAAPRRPVPTLVIGNDWVGQNTIECYPILKNSDKLLTLTGDMALVDQAEKLDDLDDIVREVGTRFRGRVLETGRERIGTITLIANSAYNVRLWELFDKAEDDPDNYLSLAPSTYDNPFLTDKDIQRYELQVGGDEEGKRVYLLGGRPLGNGKEFSKAVLERMRDPSLDAIMDAHEGEAGFTKLSARGPGVYEWALPPQEGKQYLVISDPGTENPPKRNSPVVLVWDITEFPQRPALLIGFFWIFGNHDIQTWATRYAEIVHTYKAIGFNGFDATGFQAGYDQWMTILTGLYPEKLNLSGNAKPLCLNSAKVLSTQGLIKMPVAIHGMYDQLMRYELPEPGKLHQDIVMTFILSCWWMQRLFYFTRDEVTHAHRDRAYEDRHGRALEAREVFSEAR